MDQIYIDSFTTGLLSFMELPHQFYFYILYYLTFHHSIHINNSDSERQRHKSDTVNSHRISASFDMKLTTSFRCSLAGFVVILATFANGFLIDFLPPKYYRANDSQEKPVCTSPQCVAAAEEIASSLDLEVEPCQDFYAFACGGWVRKHPVPPTEGHRNQFDLVSDVLDKQVKGLLNSDWSPEEPAPVRSAQDAFAACADEPALERIGLTPLVRLSHQLGSWPMATQQEFDGANYNPYRVVAEMTRMLGLSPLVLAYVYLDRKNSSSSVIMIDQPSLVLPRSMMVQPGTYSKQLNAYTHWIAETAAEISAYGELARPDRAKIHADAREVVEFEIQLAKLTSRTEMRRNAFRTYNAMTLKQLQQWTDSASLGNEFAALDWLAFMRAIFADLDVEIGEDERVVVKEVDYLFELVLLVDATSPRIIANYLQWRLIKTMAEDTTKRMRELSFEFDKVFSGIKEEQPRWRDCVDKTSGSLSHAVGYKYVHSYFDQASKQSAEDMVGNIREAFSDSLVAAEWMDEATRTVAKEKADAMTEFIGYPDWYNNRSALLDFYKQVNVTKNHFENMVHLKSVQVMRSFGKLRKPVDKTDWITSPDVVNAYYNPQTNSITFPAGILQPPFFSKGRPESLNYGSIGVVIGHEITHGFDDMGRQSDKDGNLVQWWSKATVDTYLGKAGCFIDQYNAYRVPELDQQLNTQVTMNGVITQGENIADNGGLNAAFRAYQRYVAKNGPEPALPGLGQFSPEQLFFIGFASVWCESTTQETLLHEVLTDPHSPHRFRVKGVLSNSDDFAKAFSCPVGSPMNPRDKCLIW